jgi:hypothetical protein
MKGTVMKINLSVVVVLLFSLVAAKAPSLVPMTVRSFVNPYPTPEARFGYSVATLGSDRLLVGAYYQNTPGSGGVGAVYLFDANGSLLTTITNPITYGSGPFSFGQAVAAMGTDRILASALFGYVSETVYLFNTNGTLLTTCTNPLHKGSGGSFGAAIRTLGDRIVIGSPYSDHGETNSGAVHLFRTNGTLIRTITNPAPALEAYFGASLASLGNDRLLVGVPGNNTGGDGSGLAYLLSTNGNVLATFTNPTPADFDSFANSIAAVGTDRVLVGALGDDTGASAAGAAYLFDTNGTLVTTYTNPMPNGIAYFGDSVAAAGAGRVLIGARYQDLGTQRAGGVFLFSTNGTLLNTITNPTPAMNDGFGVSIAAFGPDRFVVGACWDDAGTTNSGAAHLFKITPPLLKIQRTVTNSAMVSWPSPSDFQLQQTTSGVGSVNWSNVTTTPSDNGTNKYVIVNPPTGSRYYRLFRP